LVRADIAEAELIEAAVCQLMEVVHHVVMTTTGERFINTSRFHYV
jgi:hypothetical protein